MATHSFYGPTLTASTALGINLSQSGALLGGLTTTIGNTLDQLGDALETTLSPVGSTADDIIDTVADLLRGTGDESGGTLGHLINGALGSGALLGIGENSEGLLELNLAGTDVVVLPENGGIVTINADGTPGDTGDLLDLNGLLGPGGITNLTGLVGDDGLIDLNGILGSVLGLVTGAAVPTTPSDPNAPVDPAQFEKALFGTEGRDSFAITQDVSTYVDGKGEIDTVSFARSSTGLSLAVGTNATVLADDKAVYYLEDVERVKFQEATLFLDTGKGENAGTAYRLYQATFDRTPDADGVRYWVGRLDDGQDWHQTASQFLQSQEFQNTYGNTSNRQFVSTLYENVLGRSGEAEGIAFWQSYLETGKGDRASVLLSFSESNENVELVGNVIADGFIA
ncbi:DUF4214 domain-containing protein [Rhizobium sp. SSA_523]|uniref:DUF4214 domain-containing protein n=1 Tax=Rhizobium sp. SSA_523 TaxID=2952477 RepID=UPI0020903A9A|nr:DUF4214 domain-containing protein [Rhizobium sp. SSA_523]MCO5733692.1 DUF4214 domain-containing protein [Rhizobium sp. SSA_523]WKC23017.1 DUF4214 domain-containing protein [Rhizobium sp. SSA_523]